MTKKLPKRPGPKSSKQSVIVSKRGTLGETSGSNTDDSSADYTVDVGYKSTRQPNKEASEFHTPEAEDNATDYGLEFTTSQIPNPSPRRCSTLRSAEKENQTGIVSAAENDTPATSLNKSPAKATLKKANQQKPTTSRAAKEFENTTSAVVSQPPVAKKRRKQKNPIQKEKVFWNEVQKLQAQTNNLIPLLPFSRLVRELMHDVSTQVTKITPTALGALQTSAELYLTQRLQDAYMLTLHRGRVTLDVRDMHMISFLKINL